VFDITVRAFVTGPGSGAFDVGLSETWATAINNAGVIAGYYHDRNGDIEDAERGFVNAQGNIFLVDAPGGGQFVQITTHPLGISADGTVVCGRGACVSDSGRSDNPDSPLMFPIVYVINP
jgi:hypothetical protein